MRRVILITAVICMSVSLAGQSYSFSVTKTGTGEQSILFIPGFACSGDVWKETVEELKEDYTCYILTLAGFSGVPPVKDPSFENWKREIVTFINNEKIKHPILVGHSMGGGLVLAIASGFPDLARKIIIVDALPCLMAITNPDFTPDSGNTHSGMTNQIMSMNEDQFLHMLKMNAAGLTTDSSRFEEIIKWGMESDRETYAKIICDFSNTDLRTQIGNITVPSLILLEPHFRNIQSIIEEQYKNLSPAQIKYANKGLHFVMFDDKEWFIHQVHAFIKEE